MDYHREEAANLSLETSSTTGLHTSSFVRLEQLFSNAYNSFSQINYHFNIVLSIFQCKAFWISQSDNCPVQTLTLPPMQLMLTKRIFLYGVLCLNLFLCNSISCLAQASGMTHGHSTNTAYNLTLDEVERELEYYRGLYKDARNKTERDSVLNHVETFFNNSYKAIMHFWYSTSYDFDGMTEQPREGKIACGYLISTFLKHAGVNLNRIKFAQERSGKVVDVLCRPSSINTFRRIDLLREWIEEQGEGVYLVGLDTHIGAIDYYQGEITFTHASPLGAQTVVREKFDDSLSLSVASIYMVGKMSDNKALLKSWLKGDRIELETDAPPLTPELKFKFP